MILHDAKKIADGIVEMLRPHCHRIEIAGSIRRMKPDVKDIEIVAIPKPYDLGLFGYGLAPIVDQWEKVKGDLVYQKTRYTQRILPQGIKLDLFFADHENWGLIYAMRTGSAEYSHNVLAKGWVRAGFTSMNGYLTTPKGSRIIVQEERGLFDLIGIPWTEPHQRNYP